MKIIHFVDSLHPSTGGPAKSILRLMKGLNSIKVGSLIFAKHISIKDEYVINQSRNESICAVNDFHYLTSALKVLWRGESKIVHFHGVWQIKWFFLIPICLFLEMRCIISPRGMFESWSMKQGRSFLKKINIKLLYWPFRHKLIFHSTSKQEFINIRTYVGYQTNIFIIPNFIEEHECKPQYKLLNYNPRRFLCASRIHPKKGIIEFIEKVVNSFKNGEDIEINIAGPIEDKELFKRIMKAGSQNVIINYLGVLNDEELQNQILFSAYIVLTSYSENFGNIVLESLSLSTPVVVSSYTPWRDCEISNYGFLLEPDSKHTDLSPLVKVSSNKKEYKKLVIGASKKADSFSSKEYASDLGKLYGI